MKTFVPPVFTVKQLIEQLEKLDQNSIVIISEREGNYHLLLREIESAAYEDQGGSYVRIGIKQLNEELENKDFSSEDVIKDGISCVILGGY